MRRRGANELACLLARHLDPTGARVRHPQELHLHPRPAHRRRHAQSRQGAPELGVGYREAEAQRVNGVKEKGGVMDGC